MAVPDQQFQDIIDNIEKSVTDTISATLRTHSSVALDLDELREQILYATTIQNSTQKKQSRVWLKQISL